MNLLKNFRSTKVKASSILESVMTISIISICILIGTIVYAKVFETGNSLTLYKAKYKVSEMLINTSDKSFFESGNYDFKTYTIYKEVSEYSDNPYAKKIVFTVKTTHKTEVYTHIINYCFEDY